MSKSLVEQVVVGARVMVADRKMRARHFEAVDRGGEECDPCSGKAVRMWAIGALIRAAFDLTGDMERSHVLGWSIAAKMDRKLSLGSGAGDGNGLAFLNDTRGQRAVLKVAR